MKGRLYLFALLFSVNGFCQVPSLRYDLGPQSDAACVFMMKVASSSSFCERNTISAERSRGRASPVSRIALKEPSKDDQGNALVSTQVHTSKQGFHWGRALSESFIFLSIEQAYVVHDDYRWVVVEKGVPFNHYWRDYKQSLSAWMHSGWDDGDPKLYSYVGHPIQGALTGYIQVQNDPRGEKLEFSNTRAYWHSRFKALLWNAVYSTQWNIGPLSELTVEKYGTRARPLWNQDGSWPCTRKPCVTGVGQVDLVITPVGGFAWMLTEDLLDKQIARRLEGATRNSFLIDATRCALNPIRGGANILHGKWPWYRASRDASAVFVANHYKSHDRSGDISDAGERP
jgi:hypothetical protein